MPRAMTIDDAERMTCPFMSGETALVRCHANRCACWGWVDDEFGNVTSVGDTIDVPEGEEPPELEGLVARLMYPTQKLERGTITKNNRWQYLKVLGPRRGQCEAMSPYIEVTT